MLGKLDFSLSLVANAPAKLQFWREFRHALVLKVFRTCTCGEYTMFAVSRG